MKCFVFTILLCVAVLEAVPYGLGLGGLGLGLGGLGVGGLGGISNGQSGYTHGGGFGDQYYNAGASGIGSQGFHNTGANGYHNQGFHNSKVTSINQAEQSHSHNIGGSHVFNTGGASNGGFNGYHNGGNAFGNQFSHGGMGHQGIFG